MISGWRKSLIVLGMLPCLTWGGGNFTSVATDQRGGWIDGIGVGYGQSKDRIDAYRLTARNGFRDRWFESDLGYLSGYWEISANYWHGKGGDNFGVSLSPVATYVFNSIQSVTPYLEAGMGFSGFSDTKMGDRDLSTHFLFEDRLGIGLKVVEHWDLNFRYMHYSNANIKKPNDGIDIFLGSVSYLF